MRTENWFRVDENQNTQHIVFDIHEREGLPHGFVEVEYPLWFDVLEILGFRPEIVPGEILDRFHEAIDETDQT